MTRARSNSLGYSAKGDLIAGSAADTAARLAVGTDGQVLTADAASAAGVKWATPSGAGMNEQIFTSSGTWTAPTGVTKAWVLIVSGGGGAGGRSGSSGNAGAMYQAQFTVTPGTGYTVTVGAGGTVGVSPTYTGNTGGSSAFNSTTIAGGYGGIDGGTFGNNGYPMAGYNATGANSGCGGGQGATTGGSGIVIVRWLA